MTITTLILLALFLEAIVGALKPLWDKEAQPLQVAEIVTMALGVVIAVCCRINLLKDLVTLEAPAWMDYVFYVMTGIAIGRGPNFLYDLWNKLRPENKE